MSLEDRYRLDYTVSPDLSIIICRMQTLRYVDRGEAKPTQVAMEPGNMTWRRKTMAPLDWSQFAAVESIPGKRSGAWVFKDTRMPVATVFENLESGATVDEIMEWFDVSREPVTAVLEFAARRLDAPAPPVDSLSRFSIDAPSV